MEEREGMEAVVDLQQVTNAALPSWFVSRGAVSKRNDSYT